MKIITSRMKPLQLDCDGLPEYRTSETRHVTSGQSSLIDLVEYPWNRGEEMRFQDLDIFEQPRWVSREISDGPANRHDNKFSKTLEAAH